MGQNPVPPLKWAVHPPQNGTIGFDPQPYIYIYVYIYNICNAPTEPASMDRDRALGTPSGFKTTRRYLHRKRPGVTLSQKPPLAVPQLSGCGIPVSSQFGLHLSVNALTDTKEGGCKSDPNCPYHNPPPRKEKQQKRERKQRHEN